MIYDYTDKLYRQYAKIMVKTFSSLNRELQALPFDELNASKGYKEVSTRVKKAYKRLYDELVDILILMSLEAFVTDLPAVTSRTKKAVKYYVGKKDGFRREKTFDADDFVAAYLASTNYITLYVFNNEYERKLARTIEEILASTNKSQVKKAIDKAMKYWNRQAKQAGDNITAASYIEGLKAAGVKKVRWVSMEDEKVCAECGEKDGKIFDIDKILQPLHYNCRCYLEIVDK
mgnify:FL=1